MLLFLSLLYCFYILAYSHHHHHHHHYHPIYMCVYVCMDLAVWIKHSVLDWIAFPDRSVEDSSKRVRQKWRKVTYEPTVDAVRPCSFLDNYTIKSIFNYGRFNNEFMAITMTRHCEGLMLVIEVVLWLHSALRHRAYNCSLVHEMNGCIMCCSNDLLLPTDC